jgi:hypothetical protein
MMIYPADEPARFRRNIPPRRAKPFSNPSEAIRKRTPSINGLGQQRGSVMFAYILNSIYREVLRLPVRNAQVRSRLTDIPGAVSRTQEGRWRAVWATAGLACVARLMAPFKQRGSANQILTLGR